MALSHRPQGLLLDFGGVIFETRKRPSGSLDVATLMQAMAARAGHVLGVEELRSSFEAGQAALKHWKHSSSSRRAPREMTHREIVEDFIAAGLPDGPRQLFVAEAAELLEQVSTLMSDHVIRPGIPELLDFCRAERIPVGIVSNAHSGRNHRRLLREHGLSEYFGVQVYSDEVGVRKPHPRMIELAAEALGLGPGQTWYVGDTQDRDVVAGRRANVGAVLLTRSKHTDHPPFAVRHRADRVFEDPRGLLEALRQAHTRFEGLPRDKRVPTGTRPALLIDHGGVISLAEPTPEALDELAQRIAARLSGFSRVAPTGEQVSAAMSAAKDHFKQRKQAMLREFHQGSGSLPELTPREFWLHVDAHLGAHHTAWFTAEAEALMAEFGSRKSHRTLRPGIRELFDTCLDAGFSIVVVSNTVSGRAVREECRRHGLGEAIAAHVCSDEIGVRKPAPDIFREALTIADADPARTWFLGDKPANDAAGAAAVGIANRVLVTGGSTPDDELRIALEEGVATMVVDSPLSLIDHIRVRTAS